jgi:GGDEF domain-containing protein
MENNITVAPRLDGNRFLRWRTPLASGSGTLARREFQCTLSVGIAWTSDANRDAEELLREADLALYRAKDRGRYRAEAFDEDM